MADTISARVKLEGEAEFKQAVRDIDTELRVLGSALDLTAAKFDGQGNAMEGLAETQEKLQSIYTKQANKIELLKNALAKSAEKYGEADSRTANYQIQLNKAETALEKTRKKLGEVSSALEDAAKSTEDFNDAVDSTDEKGKGLGDVLDGLTGKFGVDLPENMRSTLNEMIQIDTQTLALVGGLAALATAIAKAERALVNLTRESAAYADEILTMSTTTGIATESLQEYTYAADLLDVSVETITGSQARLIRSMGAAQEGTAAQADAFAKLGVTYQNTDGTLRDAEAVFWDTIDALGRMQNETERDAVAMDLLGKSAQDLNPLIKAGSDRMAELAEEAHEMGYVLDKDALDALGEVDDAMQRLNRTTEAAKNKVAVEFAPSLVEVTEKLTKMIQNLGEALVDSGAVDAMGAILESVINVIAPAEMLGDDVVPALTERLKPLARILATIADTINAIAGLARNLWGAVTFNSDLRIDGWRQLTTALGWREGQGDLSATAQLKHDYAAMDAAKNADAVNSETLRNGYGSYYANNKWYANVESYWYEEYEKAIQKGFAGTFEYWKIANGHNSTGNTNWRGGLTWVGENGPELTYLPRGTQILNATESREVVGGDTFYITIDAKNVREFNEIVRIAQTARMNARKGVSG